jgi:hypothetical protein
MTVVIDVELVWLVGVGKIGSYPKSVNGVQSL